MKKPLFYGSIAAAIIIVIVVMLKLLSPTSYNLAISVPSPAGTSSTSASSDGKKHLDVTPETVQTALKTLSRADSFSRTYSIKSYWNNGANESDSTLKMWQKSKNMRLNISENNTAKNILVRDNKLYVWYDGVNGVFSSELSDSALSSETDKFSRLVTYEDIYNVPSGDITDAGYRDENSQSCIFAEYKSSDGNYVNQIYVSIDSGLLVSTYIHEGTALVYSMESVSSEISTPADDIFDIPTT